MKKSLFFALVFVFFTSLAFADTTSISKINITGLKNVKEKTVLSAIELEPGATYNDRAASKAVQSILAIGSFDDVEIFFNRESGVLTLAVAEKPLIGKINFKGNVQFSAGKLRSESVLKEKDFFDNAKLEETKSKINKLYQDAGFADVQIEVYPTTNPETNIMTINFLITENKKITVGGISIEGVQSFTEKKIS